MRRGAFTLIELLVVIAIIAILAAILFPVFAQAKEAAKKTSCVSNAKQLGLVMGLYAQDSDDRLPGWKWERPDTPGMRWPVYTIPPYAKSREIGFCPSISGQYKSAGSGAFMDNYMYGLTVSYGLNWFYLGVEDPTTHVRVGRTLTEPADPAGTVMLAESTFIDEAGAPSLGFWRVDPPSQWIGAPPLTYDSFGFVWPRHTNRATTLFIDGHVKGLSILPGKGTLGDEAIWDVQ